MADQIPVKANLTSGAATSLGEFAAGDTVPVTSGGTGATTASAARTALGVEATISTGTTAQYWRGDKAWRDFATDVRAAVLTGLSTATATAVTAADSVLVAIGKLQATLNGHESAWTVASTSISATSGAFSNATASVRYKRIGKSVYFSATASVVTNGSASGAVVVAMPFAAAGDFVFAGRENAVNGSGLTGVLSSGSNSLTIRTYNNAYPASDGAALNLSGVYEST